VVEWTNAYNAHDFSGMSSRKASSAHDSDAQKRRCVSALQGALGNAAKLESPKVTQVRVKGTTASAHVHLAVRSEVASGVSAGAIAGIWHFIRVGDDWKVRTSSHPETTTIR
jgi:hypothetical protein